MPNDPTVAMFAHLGLARFMTGDVEGAEQSLAHARAVAAELDFPHGPWSMAYAIWLSSWLWIETGADELAEPALAEVVEAAEEHGFEGWAVIATTQSIVLEALRDLRAGAAPETLAEHAETLALNLEVWEALGLRIFLPFYLTTTGALLAGAGDARGGARALRAVARARRRDRHALLRRRDAAPARRAGGRSAARAGGGARARAAPGRRPFEAADRRRPRPDAVIGRVAILGGGMAGLATAWRLSEPGWREEIEAITVYQRGWRLGGKGASSRGVHGRIEEHGLHLWLGYYENAFRLLRECYAELDRPATDPQARDPDVARGAAAGRDRRPPGPPRGRLAPLARRTSAPTTSSPASRSRPRSRCPSCCAARSG